jgi:thiosulfate/3-mercaptopyruvate sulfurtransferase
MDATQIVIEPSAIQSALRDGTVLVDARKAGEFKKGHIPGAIPLSTYEMLVNDTSIEGISEFAKSVADRFNAVGVRMDRPVVVYDENMGARAPRELWMLEMIGHRSARMLHGGLAQWLAEGRPVQTDIDLKTVPQRQIQISITSACGASINEIARRAGAGNLALIDVRNDIEWAGKDATPCCKRHGHIPNAIHIEWTKFLENGRFKEPKQIVQLLEENGINPHQDIATYCHRGARSANTYFALRYAGVSGARNFIGSWHEWSARVDLPLE